MTKRFRSTPPLIAVALAMALANTGSVHAAAPPLGTVDLFAVLAAQGVTAVGAALVTGNVGSSPTAAGAQPPGMIVTGTYIAVANAVTLTAQNDATAAAGNLAAQPLTGTLAVQLGGTTVNPGVYDFVGNTTADIATTTTLTLSGAGSYVFKVGTSLTANTLSNVVLANGASPCDVYWLVGAAATISAFNFPGTIIAGTAVTLNGAVNTVTIGANGAQGGRVVSQTASVTMPGNFQKSIGGCSSAPVVPPPGPVPAMPTAAGLGLLAIVLAGGALLLSRH